MDGKINLLTSQLGETRIKKDVALSDYLDSKQEGEAAAVYLATSVVELIKSVNLCNELKITYRVIGSGSKTFIPGNLLSGLLIKNRSHNLKIFGIKGKVSRAGIGIHSAYIEADSGVTLSDLSDFAGEQGLTGFEDLKQAIGTVGGSIFNNRTLNEKITHITVLDHGDIEKRENTTQLLNSDVILGAVFHLKARDI